MARHAAFATLDDLVRALLLVVAGCAAMPSAAPPLPDPDPYSTAMMALGPTGYWRMEDTSDVLVDETGSNNGSYFGSPRLGDPGFDGASVHFDGAQWGQIAGRTAYSLSRGWDDFDRSNNVAWGSDWRAQVTTSDHYAVNNHFAYIDPHGDAGTFEQGLPITLARGNLQLRATWTDHGAGLQPIALVAERVDENNFVKAELRENAEAMLELHLVVTVDGQDTDLAAAEVGPAEGLVVVALRVRWHGAVGARVVVRRSRAADLGHRDRTDRENRHDRDPQREQRLARPTADHHPRFSRRDARHDGSRQPAHRC